ncbi:MAG TPA: RodZ domain-containing protein [Steroidobacteraceae bacterium]|nr:RodZ domain-containing protein [Steroidobacteraceae bacterium]
MTFQPDGVGRNDGIGSRLRTARERAGLSLIETAEKLHVETRAIEALEAERFEEFGASVYVRGHLRHYAELVGESPAELQQLYAASGHVVQAPDLTRVPKLERARPSSASTLPGFAVVVLVALVGSAWWAAGSLHGVSRPQPVDDLSAPPPVPDSELAGSGEPTGAMPARRVGRSSVLAQRSMSGQRSVSAGSPLPVPASRLGQPLTSLAARAPQDPSTPADHATAASGAAGSAAATAVSDRRSAAGHAKVAALQLHFSEDSWAEVYDARGERLLFDVGSADSTRTVDGMPPLRVVLGNPTGVALELDGRPVAVPPGAARNVSIEFRINRSGRVAPPSHLAAAD